MSKKIKIWKRLFDIIPYYKTIYQKNTGISNPKNLIFRPKDYDGENVEEKKRFAYEDAKNHKKFYDELINEKIYPEGTKIKIKKMNHSDAYSLEMTVPKIKLIDSLFWENYEPHQRMEAEEHNEKISDKIIKKNSKLREIALKKGYNYHRLEDNTMGVKENPEGFFNEDIDATRNWGYKYGKGFEQEAYYLDLHIIHGKLPFNHRKFDEIENYIKENNERISKREKKKQEEYLKNKFSGLEKSVLGFSALAGFAFSFFFLSSNLTGNVIGNLDSSSNNFVGVLILLVSFFFAFMALKK